MTMELLKLSTQLGFYRLEHLKIELVLLTGHVTCHMTFSGK